MAKTKQKAAVEMVVGEVVLRFLEGENEGVEIRVSPPRQLTVGRSEECDIFLGEKKISRKHCQLTVSSDGVLIRDLQSTNGTLLNGKKISEAAVESDDKIKVGTSVFQVTIHADKQVVHEGASPRRDALGLGHEPRPRGSEPEAFSLENESSGVMEEPKESFSLEMERPVEASEPPPPVEEKKPKPLSGNLSAMGLADLLQNLSQNRKSGILRLTSNRVGKLWISEGRIVAAEVGSVKGTKAIYRMLGWNEGEFELLPMPEDFKIDRLEQPVTESTESLLMEGFRQFDELEKLRKGLPPPHSKLTLRSKFAAPLSKLHPRVLDVLQVVLNEGTLQAVLDASPFNDLETSKIVFYLLKKEYIASDT
ncbi:MAG TPA: DUF4388 domain-containing protein [Bdellovibrionota bacterium]|nr:DUF4388 domain-containing protein [Bdellovibrionota bacterium]